MDKKVIIGADSTCDLTPELIKKYGIVITPLHVILGENTYEDMVNITPSDIYAHFEKTGQLPKTSAVNIQEYIDTYKPYIEQGYEVVHINLGSALSTSYQHCKTASNELKGLYAVDSCNLSAGSGLLVLEAAEMSENGMSASEIVKNIEGMTNHIHCNFVVDKLDYLKAGGRCSTIAMLGANLLKIKPCIEVNNKDGSMTVGKKYRGNLSKVLGQYINDKMNEYNNISKKRCSVVHAGLPQEIVDEMVSLVKGQNYFEDIIVSRAGCTISSHCGPYTMGLICMNE